MKFPVQTSRKKSKKISGGFLFFISKFEYQIFKNFRINDKIIFILLTVFFLLGLLDDKINLNGSLK